MAISLSISIVSKLAGLVLALTKDCPLKKISKNELNAAIDDLEHLNSYSNIREGLNSALVHLESAYHNFEPSTWNFMDDKNKVLWAQRTYKNNICMTIAIIHYLLGNVALSKIWLTDKLSEYGSIWEHMPDEVHELVGLNNTKDFFNSIFNDNGETYQSKKKSIELNYESANDHHGYNPFDPRNDIGR